MVWDCCTNASNTLVSMSVAHLTFDRHPVSTELRGAAESGGIFTKDELAEFQTVTDPQQWVALARGWQARPAPTPQLVETVTADGKKVKRWVVPKVGEEYPQAEKDVNLQSKPMLLDGRRVPVNFDPGSGTYFYNGQDVSARVQEIPPQGPAPSYLWAVPPGGKTAVRMTEQEARASGATLPSAAGPEGAVKLTGAQQEDIATMLTVQDLIGQADTLGTEINWAGVGPIEGRTGPVGARWFGTGGEQAETLRNLIGNIQGTIAKLRGGTAFSAQEQIMLERYTPTITDSELVIKSKLKSLKAFIEAKRENTLRVARGEYSPRDTSAAPAEGTEGVVNGVAAVWKTVNGTAGWYRKP